MESSTEQSPGFVHEFPHCVTNAKQSLSQPWILFALSSMGSFVPEAAVPLREHKGFQELPWLAPAANKMLHTGRTGPACRRPEDALQVLP